MHVPDRPLAGPHRQGTDTMERALEARAQRLCHHLRRPLAKRGNTTMKTPVTHLTRQAPAIPQIVKGKINAYAPLTIRVLAGCWQTSQNKRKSADTVSAESVIFLFSYRYRLMISSFDGVCRRRYLPVQHQKLVIMQAVRKGSCYRPFLDCLFYAVYLVSVVFWVSLVLLGLRVFP